MKTKFRLGISIFTIVAFFVVPAISYAASPSPFVGHWQGIDKDESDIRLTIAGPPNGPFQITWTESYISFCDREAGIVRGTGELAEGDPNELKADLHLECFTIDKSTDFSVTWLYDPVTNTISSSDYIPGEDITWFRPGKE